MKDLLNVIHAVPAIAPAAAYTDDTGIQSVTVDRQGYESLTFLISTGSLADADATFAVSLDHSDTDWSGSEPVSAGEILGGTANAGFTFEDDDQCRKIAYVGDKRYVRLTVTPSGNTGNAFIAAVALLGHPHVAATPNPPQA